MNITAQKRLRVLTPGILILLAAAPFLILEIWHDLSDYGVAIKVAAFPVSMGMGMLYNALQGRRLANHASLIEINQVITTSINERFREDIHGSLTWHEIRPIYYSFIDNDKSLVIQSEIIRTNGFLWSSAADLQVISCFATMAYIVLATIFAPDVYFWVSLGFCFAFVIGQWLLSETARHHIQLVRDQLHALFTNHHDSLKTRLLQIKVRASGARL